VPGAAIRSRAVDRAGGLAGRSVVGDKGRGQEHDMTTPERRLEDMGLALPTPAAPIANYVPAVISGSLLFISGQLCLGPDGKLADRHKGKLGGTVPAEAGTEAARFCAINLLAQAKAALGDLSRIRRCVKLTGFINATPEFGGLAPIMNGASDLMVAVLGEAGRHARSTVGMAVLPLEAAVEVEAIFEIA
jgi:enamine deaminase RidA (YjgF/YER057c/UK114 family)